MRADASEPVNGIERYVATVERRVRPSLVADGPIVLHLQSYGRINVQRREKVFDRVTFSRCFIDTEKLKWHTIDRMDKKLRCSGTNGRVMLNIAVARGMCW